MLALANKPYIFILARLKEIQVIYLKKELNLHVFHTLEATPLRGVRLCIFNK